LLELTRVSSCSWVLASHQSERWWTASRPGGSTSRARTTRSASSDIALLPEYCNRGIGTTLLRDLQSEAAAAGKPLRIHVERFNPTLRLYERLGFRQIDDRGVYLFMEWREDNSQRSNPSTCSGLP
jgi:GNAT superfamily N-acetyltransferase